MTPDQTRDTVIRVMQAAGEGGLESALDAFAPDCEWHWPPFLPYGGDFSGRENLPSLVARVAEVLDFSTMTLDDVIAGTDSAAIALTANLMGGGEEHRLIEHWHFRDGLISDVRVFWFEPPA